MSMPAAREDHPAVVLLIGLLSIGGLLYVSLLALSGPTWMGVLFGAIELALAWRVTPPAGGQALRGVAALIGSVTVLWAIVSAFVA